MTEGRVFAVAKKPLLSRESAYENGYKANIAHWKMYDLHTLHGGSPVIVGVVTIDMTQSSRQFPRYKLLFPDGFVDYARLDNFDQWYDMITE